MVNLSFVVEKNYVKVDSWNFWPVLWLSILFTYFLSYFNIVNKHTNDID